MLLLGGGDREERVAEEVEGGEVGVVHVGLDGVVGEELAGVFLHHLGDVGSALRLGCIEPVFAYRVSC